MRDAAGRLRGDPAVAGVVVATVLALLARLWQLGVRTAHQDEARVAWRILQYADTGVWEYRPIVHGPFLFHVNELLFGVVEPSDFSARLVVAVVGGLFPLVALLFRSRLRDAEVVTLAALLAANPLLLYYSRFMRNDVLVGAFMLAALGFGVRAHDRGTSRDLYPAAACLALAFTAKENALVYLGLWAGAAALVADRRLLLAPKRGEDPVATLVGATDRAAAALDRWLRPLALAAAEAVVILVVFYAPRPDLYRAVTDPTRLPGVVGAATVGAWQSFWGVWVAGDQQDNPFLPFLFEYLGVLFAGAFVVVCFGIGGLLLDRYVDGGRPLVQFAGFWGVAAAFVSPLSSDISAPWMGVHTVVALAIPAAVGLAAVYRQGRLGVAYDDRLRVALAAVVLVAAGAQVGLTAAETAYVHHQDPGPLVQYGQPDDDLKPALPELRAVVGANAGVDVAFYGTHFGTPLFRMPFPWYLGAMGAETTHTTAPGDLADDPPPVVIAPNDRSVRIGDTARDVRPYLDGYTRLGPYAIVLALPNNEVYADVYVNETALAATGLE